MIAKELRLTDDISEADRCEMGIVPEDSFAPAGGEVNEESDEENTDSDSERWVVISRSRLLVHGVPTPRMGRRHRRRGMVSIYVDDFIVVVLQNSRRKRTLGAATRIRNL